MSYLLVGGCSWSDLNFISVPSPEVNTDYPKWSEHLAEKMGIPLVSVARMGSGNQVQYQALTEHILSDNPPSHVVWQLSGAFRKQLPGDNWQIFAPGQNGRATVGQKGRNPWDDTNVYENIDQFVEDIKDIRNTPLCPDRIRRIQHVYKEILGLAYHTPTGMLEYNFKLIYQMKKLCENMGIRFLIFRSDHPFYDNNRISEVVGKKDSADLYRFLIDFSIQVQDYRGHEHPKAKDDFLHYDHPHENIWQKMFELPIFKKLEDDQNGVYGWPFHPILGGNIIPATTNKNKRRGMGVGNKLEGTFISEFDGHPNGNGQKRLYENLLPILNEYWDMDL